MEEEYKSTNVLVNEEARRIIFRCFSRINYLIEKEGVQEIMINGENDIWVEENGVIRKENTEMSANQIHSAIKILASMNDRDLKKTDGLSIIDTRIDKLRIAAAIEPTSVLGPMISIRKQSSLFKNIHDYSGIDSLNESKFFKETTSDDEIINTPEDITKFLLHAIKARKNILISGGTSSGKTTFAKAVINEIDKKDRVVVIEDTPEISSVPQILPPNRVCLQSNIQLKVATADLVKLSLRLRPDRIIVGEIRGAEAFDLIQALNTGHDGGITTLHANNAFDTLSRLEVMVLMANMQWPFAAIRNQISRTFDYVVFMSKSESGKRGISEIMKIKGTSEDGSMYDYQFLWPK